MDEGLRCGQTKYAEINSAMWNIQLKVLGPRPLHRGGGVYKKTATEIKWLHATTPLGGLQATKSTADSWHQKNSQRSWQC